MNSIIAKIRLALTDAVLMRRIGFMLLLIGAFRVLSVIPIPGVNEAALASLLAQAGVGQFLGIVNVLSGGGLSQLSIVMLGIGPYITASIIMQLLTIMSPRLKAMYQGEDGQGSRQKYIQYGRMITVPIAIVQGFSFLSLLQNQGVLGGEGYGLTEKLIGTLIITAGALVVMWIGELISEFGIGNGSSMIVATGIVAGLPKFVAQNYLSFTQDQLPIYIAFAVAAFIAILAVVFINEAERPIPVTYAKQVRGNRVYGGISTYLPIRLIQAGVMPIIFALSIIAFPQILVNLLTFTNNTRVISFGQEVITFLNMPWIYGLTTFVLVFLFTYFFSAVTFDPHQISENLQKRGAFIPGVRPGQSTAEHLGHTTIRLNLFGAIFLGLIAVLPVVVSSLTQVQTLALGGTSLLIIVSVILDTLKKINAQLTAKEY